MDRGGGGTGIRWAESGGGGGGIGVGGAESGVEGAWSRDRRGREVWKDWGGKLIFFK